MVVLFAGVRGHLDDIEVADIGRFEEGLLSALRDKGAEILGAIRDENELSEETEEKLKKFVEDYARTYS